jgi:aryl-alcohol dehydrogenase-like predicted oxidoreductase
MAAMHEPIDRRRLGRTGHMSSLAILGMAAFAAIEDTAVADAAIAEALEGGVNHIDVAPQYGRAQEHLGRTLPAFRDRVLLGCKSLERTRDGFWRDLENSLRVLCTDRIDLHQFHAVVDDATLDAILGPGGAAEAMLEARDQGLVRWIGLTGHMEHVARVANRALEVIDLDTVMLPVNPAMMALPDYRRDLEQLFATAAERDLGVMGIKAVARGPWGAGAVPAYHTWYQPLEERDAMQRAVNFALSQRITAVPTVGDLRLLPAMLDCVRAFTPMSAAQIEAEIECTSTQPLLMSRG